MEEIDVAIFAFDGDQQLRLVNRAGERLLAQPSERIMNAERSSARTWRSFWAETKRRTSSERFPRAPGAGESIGRRFAKADCRINCWWSRI